MKMENNDKGKNEESEKSDGKLKKFKMMFFFMGIFYTLAIVLAFLPVIFIGSVNWFYLFNFFFIGTSMALGMGLWPILAKKNRDHARRLSQALVGGYLFFGLGLGLVYFFFGMIIPENMQFEGFWFMLLAGSFSGPVLHYFIAKIFGPFSFSRGWCGWACWTAAVLDYLPWKKSPGRVSGKWGYFRYLHFGISTILVISLIVLGITHYALFGLMNLTGIDLGPTSAYITVYQIYWLIPELWWFLLGNLLYYGVGIVLAIILKDNRAFCKYVCPITAFLKVGARFSIVKLESDPEKCNDCKACEKVCPMDILITEYTKKRERIGSSECIFCFKCITACPQQAISISSGFDRGKKELLRKKKA